MDKQLILVLGGARSGKSTYAQNLAGELGGRDVLYVATAEARDEEMRARISVHQSERPAGWRTVELPQRVGVAVAEAAGGAAVVLVDCMTLLASNTILALGDDPGERVAGAALTAEVDALLATYRAGTATWIVVSNEVGLGLVPPYPLGRLYRDLLGRANQQLAAAATGVLFLVAGLPMKVK